MKGKRVVEGDLVFKRDSRGRNREGVSFPVPPKRSVMPTGYAGTLKSLKERIRNERIRVALSANSAMVMMYWEIGRVILERQSSKGWGAKVIDRLSADLRDEFPDMRGLSPRNLMLMRAFAEAYPQGTIVKQLVSQLPWGHVVHLIQRVKAPEVRIWYARAAIAGGWSRNILDLQIASQAHRRQGKAINNFALTLPPADSDMAAQIFKDPYLFDFIGTADPRREREVEQALVDHVQKFLLEMGAGFAFVGRQVHLEFSTKDYYLDLLFYHLKLRSYVVVELKAVPFEPEFLGKLNVYMSAVDDLLRHPDDKPTIGLLLCKGKDRIVAEYALRGSTRPIGVADWHKQLTETLPPELKGSLPSVEELEAELSDIEEPDESGGNAVRETSPRYGSASGYSPPYSLTPMMIRTVEEIGEAVGRLCLATGAVQPRLQRDHRIRTVQASCSIEGNPLTVEQVTALLDGKRVLGSHREVQEIRNAFAAYEAMGEWSPCSCDDLLSAHRVLMTGLVDAPGRFRSGGVGIRRGDAMIHVAPPAHRVPALMNDLLAWLKATPEHPLIASCIFHYEFEFIHPFPDGNGRMGRLWQTLILSRWNPLFAFIPVETLTGENRANYYAALNASNQAASSNPFVEFMLTMIRDALLAVAATDQGVDHVTDQVKRLLAVMSRTPMSARELMSALGLSHRPTFRQNYLQPALAAGLIKMTRPDSPRARDQKYARR